MVNNTVIFYNFISSYAFVSTGSLKRIILSDRSSEKGSFVKSTAFSDDRRRIIVVTTVNRSAVLFTLFAKRSSERANDPAYVWQGLVDGWANDAQICHAQIEDSQPRRPSKTCKGIHRFATTIICVLLDNFI